MIIHPCLFILLKEFRHSVLYADTCSTIQCRHTISAIPFARQKKSRRTGKIKSPLLSWQVLGIILSTSQKSFLTSQDFGQKGGHHFHSISWEVLGRKSWLFTDSNEWTYMYLLRNIFKSSFRRLTTSFPLLCEAGTKTQQRNSGLFWKGSISSFDF